MSKKSKKKAATGLSAYANPEAHVEDKQAAGFGVNLRDGTIIANNVTNIRPSHKKGVSITILGSRRFKQYSYNNVDYAVHYKTYKKDMPKGVTPVEKFQYYMVCNEDLIGDSVDESGNVIEEHAVVEAGTPMVWGSSTRNVINFFFNPSSGKYKSPLYPTGVWSDFLAVKAEIAQENGMKPNELPLYLFKFSFAFEKKATKATKWDDPNTFSMIHRLKLTKPLELLEDEEQYEINAGLFDSLGIRDWMMEYHTEKGVAVTDGSSPLAQYSGDAIGAEEDDDPEWARDDDDEDDF